MKFCCCFILALVSLLALSAAETCYKYNSYYGSHYGSYCSGYCAGSAFSEYCLYYYYKDGQSGGGSGSTTIVISLGCVGGLCVFGLICFFVKKYIDG